MTLGETQREQMQEICVFAEKMKGGTRCKEEEGKHMVSGGGLRHEREGEWSDEGAEEGEQNRCKKKVEGELAYESGLQKQRATVELKDMEQDGTRKWKVLGTTALTRNKGQLFPATRGPELGNVTPEDEVPASRVEEWFASTVLQVSSRLTDRESERGKRLLYTLRDVFERDLLRIRKTDPIEHAIILEPGAKPYRARIPLYTEEEINFCKRLLPEMEKAGLIFLCDSDWGAPTKFPLKPRADTLPKNARLRMVHNFIPINRVSEKSRYPCPRIEQIVYTVVKTDKPFFFTTDAANPYWAIPVRPGDEPKLGFVTPNGMYCYSVIGQGLTEGTHTYCRFRDLVFRAIREGFCEEN